MAKNMCGKRRPVNDPYEVWVSGEWEFRVLKKYQSEDAEKKNPYARHLVAYKSTGSVDKNGHDSYLADYRRGSEMVYDGKVLNPDYTLEEW